jgi:hypothetical protein
MRFRLRTLLIVLAIGPMVLAFGYWFWQWSRPSPWFVQDSFNPPYILPEPKPGYHWKLTRDRGLIEVPIQPSRQPVPRIITDADADGVKLPSVIDNSVE